ARQMAEAAAAAAELETQSAAAAAELKEAEARAHELGERVNRSRQHAQQIERDWHGVEVEKREVEVKREALEQRSQEELGLDLAWEHPEYAQMMAAGGVTRIDQAAAAAEIDALREEIRKLGNVNLE